MQRTRENITGHWIIFFIWPFGALLRAVKNIKTRWAKNLIWAFCAYFGFTMVTASEGADYTRYVQWLKIMNQQSFDFKVLGNMMFAETNAFVDLLQPLVTFIVAQFTDDGRILYAMFGLVFGYFYSGNIFYLSRHINFRRTNWSLFLLIIFSIIVPFWEINGFRFWTAAHIFLYGALPYLFERNKSSLIWVWLSLLVHFSFFLPAVIFTINIFFGNRLNIYFILFIVSLTVSELDLRGLSNTLSFYAPEFLLPKIRSYLNPDYAERIAEQVAQTNWYVGWSLKGMKYAITILFFYLFLFQKSIIMKNEKVVSLFSFSLLFTAFSNITSLVPSGGRFVTVSFLFSITFLIMLTNHILILKRLKPILVLCIPAFILFFIVKMRMGFDFIGFAAIVGNPFISGLFNNDIPLIDLIK
uniref:EpsG family protein n=1 Tax=Ignavibacterium album TaxID=591197 RepID=A0A832DHH5_9BACT